MFRVNNQPVRKRRSNYAESVLNLKECMLILNGFASHFQWNA